MLSPYVLWSQASSCLCAVYRCQRFLARGKGEQRYPRAISLQENISTARGRSQISWNQTPGSRSPDPLTATTPPALYVCWRRLVYDRATADVEGCRGHAPG